MSPVHAFALWGLNARNVRSPEISDGGNIKQGGRKYFWVRLLKAPTVLFCDTHFTVYKSDTFWDRPVMNGVL